MSQMPIIKLDRPVKSLKVLSDTEYNNDSTDFSQLDDLKQIQAKKVELNGIFSNLSSIIEKLSGMESELFLKHKNNQ